MNKQLNKSLLTLVTIMGFVLASGGYASADFLSTNHITGFNSLNDVNSNTAQVIAESNLNHQIVTNDGNGVAGTGDNFADFNTGSGAAGSGIANITGGFGNELNLNEILQSNTGNLGLFSAINDTTGAESTNNANSLFSDSIDAHNLNEAKIDNLAWISGQTGHNRAKGNTGAGSIESGSAAANVVEANMVNGNSIHLLNAANGLFSSLAENAITGFDSVNNANTSIKNNLIAKNDNKADIYNNVHAKLDTGNNVADFNTGTGGIRSGNALADILEKNNANSNEISVGFGGLTNGLLKAKNIETGAKSTNNANSKLENNVDVINKNVANLENNADVNLNTGNNSASFNTGGAIAVISDPVVNTGDAIGKVKISNDFINANSTTVLGPTGPTSLESANKVTGFDSVNNANSLLENNVDVNNSNCADVQNDVNIHANTGNNQADSNTGSGLVSTGDAGAQAEIKNNLNVNDTKVVTPIVGAVSAVNEATGANSTNNANSKVENDVNVTNTNNSTVNNDVNLTTNTGDNSASFNTGSGTVLTGGAAVTFQAVNTGNINSTQVGN